MTRYHKVRNVRLERLRFIRNLIFIISISLFPKMVFTSFSRYLFIRKFYTMKNSFHYWIHHDLEDSSSIFFSQSYNSFVLVLKFNNILYSLCVSFNFFHFWNKYGGGGVCGNLDSSKWPRKFDLISEKRFQATCGWWFFSRETRSWLGSDQPEENGRDRSGSLLAGPPARNNKQSEKWMGC